MIKFLKNTGLVLITLILLIVLGIGIIVTFVSPNQFKPVITAQVLKYAGRELTIDGNLSWSFYPYLGFKAGHTALSNAAGFKQKIFAEINSVTVGIKLMPLLEGKIETSALTLDGLKVYLVKNADGTTNWQDLAALGAAGASGQTATTDESAPAAKAHMRFSLNIPAIDISNSQIVWHDIAKQQTATLSHFELHAKDINPVEPFSVVSTFAYVVQNPALSGQGSVSGLFKMNLPKQILLVNGLTFDLAIVQAGHTMQATIKGDVVADMLNQAVAIHKFTARLSNLQGIKQPFDMQAEIAANLASDSIKLTQFTGKLANLTLNGNVTVSNYKTASGHLQAQPFDVKALLQAIGRDTGNIQTAKMLSADFNFSASSPALPAITLQGKVKLDDLQAAKLKMTNLNMQAQLQNGILTLTPVTAALYQGTLNGTAKVNLLTAIPQISVQAQLANVQAEPLLQDLQKQSNKFKVKGAGNIDVQVTTAGLDADSIVRNLNGSGKLSFNNGQLSGVNIGYMIDRAFAVIKQQPAPAQGEDVTNFGTMTATVSIASGIITNNDLLMNSPRFNTKGRGTINLVSQQINYLLTTTPANLNATHTDNDVLNLANLSIPVRITGSLSDPSISLDTGAIISSVAKQQIQKVTNKVQDKIREQIKARVPGQAGQMLQNLFGN